MADVVLHSSSLINYINIEEEIFCNPTIQNQMDFIAVVERGSCSVGDKTCTFHRLYRTSRTLSTCQPDSCKRKLSTDDKCLGDGQNKINSSTEKVGRNVGDALIKRSGAWSWEVTSHTFYMCSTERVGCLCSQGMSVTLKVSADEPRSGWNA